MQEIITPLTGGSDFLQRVLTCRLVHNKNRRKQPGIIHKTMVNSAEMSNWHTCKKIFLCEIPEEVKKIIKLSL
jgi:hypothetical protein